MQSGTRASMLVGSLRLFRSRAFCGYVLGGACTTTSFYAFMAASPFILVDLLHQSTERVGLYYLLLMAGVAAGGLSANRLAGRIRPQLALRLANSIAIAGAACFMLADIAGWLNVVTVIAPIVVFMIGAGMASPFALTGAVSVNPHAIGAASGVVRLYPDGVWRAVHRHRRGVAARLGVPRRGGAGGVRTVGASGIVTRGAAGVHMTLQSARQQCRGVPIHPRRLAGCCPGLRDWQRSDAPDPQRAHVRFRGTEAALLDMCWCPHGLTRLRVAHNTRPFGTRHDRNRGRGVPVGWRGPRESIGM